MNPLQANLGGEKDGFVAKLNATGSALLYATYLGGVLDDSVNAIAIDQTGNAYLGGETYSSNFPVKDAFQPVKAGHFLVNSSLGNGFIAKLMPAGNALAYSSFLGGEVCTSYCQLTIFGVPAPRPQYAGDAVYGIALDGQGHALLTGVANSYSFPLVDSRLPRKQEDNQNSLFVTKVAREGAALLYSSLLYTGFGSTTETDAGIPADIAHAIAADGAGNAYVTLQQPADFPATPGAYQPVSNMSDAVVFKLSSGSAALTMGTSTNPSVGGNTVTISASVAGAAPAGVVIFFDRTAVIGTAPVLGGAATLSLALPVGIRTLSAVYRDSVSEADSGVVYQVVNPLNICQ
jgi:Bacterial Ig-like domain (group 3)/Beta-propeller repeat